MYNEWHEHIGFTGWNCAIGVSQWDAEEEEEPPQQKQGFSCR